MTQLVNLLEQVVIETYTTVVERVQFRQQRDGRLRRLRDTVLPCPCFRAQSGHRQCLCTSAVGLVGAYAILVEDNTFNVILPSNSPSLAHTTYGSSSGAFILRAVVA